MTALSAERQTVRVPGALYAFPVKANTKIWKGSLVVIDAGYAAPGRAATGLIAVGMARETVDNTGGLAGALNVEVEPGIFHWENSAAGDAITQAEVGTQCYVVDDQTVAKTDGGGARSEAGSIVSIEKDGVLVLTRFDVSLRGVDMASLGTRLDAEEAATATAVALAARRKARFIGPIAAPADLHAAFAGGSGAIDVNDNFTAPPLPARQVQIVCLAGCAVGVATVDGTDEAGSPLSVALAMGDGLTTKSARAFASITRFRTNIDPGADKTVTLQTGAGFGLGGPVTAIHGLSVDGVREAAVQSSAANGFVEPTTAPDGDKVFAVQVTD